MNASPTNKTLDNLKHLTARAMLGEWEDEAQLRNQFMRLYREAEYAPPDGVELVLQRVDVPPAELDNTTQAPRRGRPRKTEGVELA